jgi:hypothetical protein
MLFKLLLLLVILGIVAYAYWWEIAKILIFAWIVLCGVSLCVGGMSGGNRRDRRRHRW